MTPQPIAYVKFMLYVLVLVFALKIAIDEPYRTSIIQTIREGHEKIVFLFSDQADYNGRTQIRVQ